MLVCLVGHVLSTLLNLEFDPLSHSLHFTRQQRNKIFFFSFGRSTRTRLELSTEAIDTVQPKKVSSLHCDITKVYEVRV